MGLGAALSTALGGLRVTNAGLSLVAGNVANADTPGYVKKTVAQVSTVNGDHGIGVRSASVQRVLDAYVQRQLRVEYAGGAYAGTRADMYARLNAVYGEPGSAGSIEHIFNAFTQAVQALTTSPDTMASRSGMLGSAQVLAQQLNAMSADIQALRNEAEQQLGQLVPEINTSLREIARLNAQLATASTQDAAQAALLDQRDLHLDRLSQLMDVRIVPGANNQVSVFTSSGAQLVGLQAAEMKFTPSPHIGPENRWSADPAQRSVGTITLVGSNGGMDLIAAGAFRAGEVAALIEMRDSVLPDAQAQLDGLAAAMARALSDRGVDSTTVTAGAQAGRTIDLAGLQPGNTVSLTYTDVVSGTQHRVTIMRVDEPAALPLPHTATADSGDQVIGVDFSGGMAAVATQLNAALGPGLQFSNPAGMTLQVLDDGAGNTRNVDALSAIVTTTGLTGQLELPLFTDGGAVFSGAWTASGPRQTGLASRIAVNPAILADPAKLVVYAPGVLPGDGARPNFILDRLTNATATFAPAGGVGTAGAPYTGSLPSYLNAVLSQQGQAAASAQSLAQGQAIVVDALQQRMDEQSAVNIDEEMTQLINLQNAYGANARVLTAVREMMDMLLNL